MLARFLYAAQLALGLAVCASALSYSTPPTTSQVEEIRAFTRNVEFGYLGWTLDAAWTKLQASSVAFPHSVEPRVRQQIVADYLELTRRCLELEADIERLYSLPPSRTQAAAANALQLELQQTAERQQELAPLAEAVVEAEVAKILERLGLTVAGQPVPGVLFHITPLPSALIVSPRDAIEQLVNISLETDLDLVSEIRLETEIAEALDVSTLIVPIGGVGVYPTMVTRSTDLPWLVETVAHEWVHNFLTLRPLGALYDATPELRTMNETAAAIAGGEVASIFMASSGNNPLVASRPEAPASIPSAEPEGDPPPPIPFDFNSEMHKTRVMVDALLAAGKVDAAEAYMEARRNRFVGNGYYIRRLNQAYFAFYGAYGDVPGGAAGEDPVGAAVRGLRETSPSLADFLNRISWMTSFQQLMEAVNRPAS